MRFCSLVMIAAFALIAAGCTGPMTGAQQEPEMNVSGTLTRAQTSDGKPGTYYLSGMMGMNYQLVNVPASAEPLIGKQVAVTGNMDSSGSSAGTMRIKVKKIEVLEGAPSNQGSAAPAPGGAP